MDDVNVCVEVCAICDYVLPSQHLRSGKHVEYANNEANFARLDRLISQGTKFNDFVSRLRNKRRSPVKNRSGIVLRLPMFVCIDNTLCEGGYSHQNIGLSVNTD